MKVRNVDHIALAVKDVNESLRFYTDILGLEPLRVDEFRKNEVPFPSVRVSKETIIDLFERPREGVADNADHFCLIIEDEDMEALSADLRGKGVEIQQDVIRRWGALGYGLSIYIKDPDGNTVELKSYRPA